MDIGIPELLIILVIVLLIFGVGRLGKIGGELGTAIRQFREGLNPGNGSADKDNDPSPAPNNNLTVQEPLPTSVSEPFEWSGFENNPPKKEEKG